MRYLFAKKQIFRVENDENSIAKLKNEIRREISWYSGQEIDAVLRVYEKYMSNMVTLSYGQIGAIPFLAYSSIIETAIIESIPLESRSFLQDELNIQRDRYFRNLMEKRNSSRPFASTARAG